MNQRRSSPPAKTSRPRPQQVRIIGGQWKRTPLPVLDAEGLRPTPDRVRETVFNWLNFLWDNTWQQRRVLDLFAGTGALGFEAASRGAAEVVLYDNHGPACRQMRALQEKLQATQIRVQQGDALLLAGRLTPGFDLIFIDPPYQSALWERALQTVRPLLAPAGLIYLELPKEQGIPPFLEQWEIVRSLQAGMLSCFLLQSNDSGKIR